MEVINDLLGYDGLKIVQDPDMFSFSLDSILLANFATINKSMHQIMDLCTGNAPIPLYLTLRTDIPIVGVEIQKKAYELAIKSVKMNIKESQISIINDDLKGINKKGYYQKFDLVTCNPPFFKYNEGSNINANEFLSIARHEIFVKLDEILDEAFSLLNNGGYFAMVHRPERLIDVLEAFRRHKIEPKRLRFVYPRMGEEANHILIEGKKNGRPDGLKILSPLYVYDDNNWTTEVKKIYNYPREE